MTGGARRLDRRGVTSTAVMTDTAMMIRAPIAGAMISLTQTIFIQISLKVLKHGWINFEERHSCLQNRI